MKRHIEHTETHSFLLKVSVSVCSQNDIYLLEQHG
jgi:hypothetical protein